MPGHPHTQSPFIRVISLPQRDNPPARQAALYRIAVNSRGTLALEENRTLCVNGGRRSVHRLVARASRHRIGAFVYTVALP